MMGPNLSVAGDFCRVPGRRDPVSRVRGVQRDRIELVCSSESRVDTEHKDGDLGPACVVVLGGIGGNDVSHPLRQSDADRVDNDSGNRGGGTGAHCTFGRCGDGHSEHGSAVHFQRKLHSATDRSVKGQQDSHQLYRTAGAAPLLVGGYKPRFAPRSGGRPSVLWSVDFAGWTPFAACGTERNRPRVGRHCYLEHLWGPEYDLDSADLPGARPERLMSSNARRI